MNLIRTTLFLLAVSLPGLLVAQQNEGVGRGST